MTEEIKKIFYKLRSDDYYEKHYQQSVYYEKDLNKLENYITNLQKENENLKNNYNDNEQAIHKIMEENEKLKDELYSANQVVNELLDIQSRNEKAIKYIITNKPIYIEQKGTSCIIKVTDVLLNILECGDEE